MIRAWPANNILRRYYLVRSAGMAGAATLERQSTAMTYGAPQKWLLKLCEIGAALEALPDKQRKAVDTRWQTWMELNRIEGSLARTICQERETCQKINSAALLTEELVRRGDPESLDRAKALRKKIGGLGNANGNQVAHIRLMKNLRREYRKKVASATDCVAYQKAMELLHLMTEDSAEHPYSLVARNLLGAKS